MPLQITKATIQDVNIIAPLFDAYRIFYKQASNIAAAQQFLTERLANNESVIYIALKDGVAVGFCQLFPIFSSVGLKRTWLLNDLYVAATARGGGVATALLAQAKQFGIDTNARWLLLQTTADNTTAQSVYEKNGWVKLSDYFYELGLA
jgi:GNAT superfamily N-acetyltransferase